MRPLILICALTCTMNIFAKQCDCEKYAIGNFYTLTGSRDLDDTLFIERTATYQLERKHSGYEQKHHIKWLNKCKYVVYDNDRRNNVRYAAKDVFIKIIETFDNHYRALAWAYKGKKMYFTIYVYNPQN